MKHLPLSAKSQKVSVVAALIRSLILLSIFGGLGTLAAYEPDFQGTPVIGLTIVWFFSLTLAVANFRYVLKPSWFPLFIIMFSMTNLFLAVAVHALSPYLSGWPWIALLIGTYLLAWSLPLLNPRLAKALNDEQLRPKTWLGRNQALIVLLIAILSAILIGIFDRGGTVPIHPIMLFIGTTFSILAIGTGQYFAYQVRKSWEEQTRRTAG